MDIEGRLKNVERQVGRLGRADSVSQREVSRVTVPGDKAGPYCVRVDEHVEFNVYMVSPVHIGAAGMVPLVIAEPVEAVNVAEAFGQPGSVSAGTYAVMFSVGQRYIFYAKV